MLLAELKTKTEQDAFVNLAYVLASADGNLGYAEQTLINMYTEEMGIDSVHQLNRESLFDACHVFTEEYIKKIVLINLISLAFVDGYNNYKQKNILDVIRRELSLSSTEVRRYEEEMNILKAPYFPNYMD